MEAAAAVEAAAAAGEEEEVEEAAAAVGEEVAEAVAMSLMASAMEPKKAEVAVDHLQRCAERLAT